MKNKAPAEIQITAEQLLREAKERDLEILPPVSMHTFIIRSYNIIIQMLIFFYILQPPKQKISDKEELADYQLRKRKQFEDDIRKNRNLINNWIKYAKWEESQKEIQRYIRNLTY